MHMTDLSLPSSYIDLLAHRPADRNLQRGMPRFGTTGDEWLEALPRLIRKALNRWELSVRDEPIAHGMGGLVMPVRSNNGSPIAVPVGTKLRLKFTWPHDEAQYEHLALRAWDGNGAARLYTAEPKDYAIVIEELRRDTDLDSRTILDACQVSAALLIKLAHTAGEEYPSLIGAAQEWQDQLTVAPRNLPRRLVGQASSLLRDLSQDLIENRVQGNLLIHTDLHGANILAAPQERAGGAVTGMDGTDWVAIDPKVLRGELAYGIAPMMWNRTEDMRNATNARGHIRMRADIMTDVAELDEDRVRAWTFVRLILNALWAAEDADEEQLTRAIYLAKFFAA